MMSAAPAPAAGLVVDYRYTRCPACGGLGTNPDACHLLGCRPHANDPDGNGHEHLCSLCGGADYDPEGAAEQAYKTCFHRWAKATSMRRHRTYWQDNPPSRLLCLIRRGGAR